MVVYIPVQVGIAQVFRRPRQREYRIEVDCPALDLAVAGNRIHRQPTVGLPDQAPACRGLLRVVDLVIIAGELVVKLPIRLAVKHCQPAIQLVGHQRPADHRLGLFQVVVTQGALGAGLKFLGGALGVDDNRAGDRVASVQGTLGTLQHLDLLHVVQLTIETIGIGDEYAVHDVGEGGFCVAGGVLPADGHLGVAGVGCIHYRHIRCQRYEVLGPVYARALDIAGGKRGDRDRDILQVFRAPPRDHHHFLQLRLLGQRELRYRQGRADQGSLYCVGDEFLIHYCAPQWLVCISFRYGETSPLDDRASGWG